MHARDIVDTPTTVGLDDDLLSAIRHVLRLGLPGIVAADEHGSVVGCLSLVDLVGVALPRYLRNAPALARTIDESYADRIVAALAGIRVGDAVRDAGMLTPVVRPSATAVELAELMVRERCPLVIVEPEGGGARGVVTAHGLLDRLVATAEGPPQ